VLIWYALLKQVPLPTRHNSAIRSSASRSGASHSTG